jgi:hypothetical protein
VIDVTSAALCLSWSNRTIPANREFAVSILFATVLLPAGAPMPSPTPIHVTTSDGLSSKQGQMLAIGLSASLGVFLIASVAAFLAIRKSKKHKKPLDAAKGQQGDDSRIASVSL